MSYGLNQAYDRLSKVGDPLSQINSMLDWEQFRPIKKPSMIIKRKKEAIPTSIVF